MENIILPNYDHSILNTITSILKYYNVETNHKSLEKLDKELQKKYKNVVFIILDGMGEHILTPISPKGYFKQNVYFWMDENGQPIWKDTYVYSLLKDAFDESQFL